MRTLARLAAPAFLLAASTTAGCLPTGSFAGEIDGENGPTFFSAFYGQGKDGDVQLTQLHAFSFATSCDKLAAYLEEDAKIREDFAESDDPDDDREDAAAELTENDRVFGLPKDFWAVSFAVVTVDEELEEGTDSDDAAIYGASLAHRTDLPDYEDVLDGDEDKDVTVYLPLDVDDIEVLAFEEDGPMQIGGDVELADLEDVFEDGEDADAIGEGELKVTAAHCAALDDKLDDDAEQLAAFASNDDDDDEDPVLGEGEGETDPPVDPAGVNGSCTVNLGAGDGCDCGCGIFDSDCTSFSSTVCQFPHCQVGVPAVDDNSQCE